MPDPTLLADGLRFAEAPRWLGDRLWFSDVHAYQLKTVRLDGTVDVVADAPGRPSGLGALPDGRMLMATALDRRLLAVGANGFAEEVGGSSCGSQVSRRAWWRRTSCFPTAA